MISLTSVSRCQPCRAAKLTWLPPAVENSLKPVMLSYTTASTTCHAWRSVWQRAAGAAALIFSDLETSGKHTHSSADQPLLSRVISNAGCKPSHPFPNDKYPSSLPLFGAMLPFCAPRSSTAGVGVWSHSTCG
eukprot:4005100-Prymnesium_polylepis.3